MVTHNGSIHLYFFEDKTPIKVSPLADIIIRHWFNDWDSNLNQLEHWSTLNNNGNYLYFETFYKLLKKFIMDRFNNNNNNNEQAINIINKLEDHIDCLNYIKYNRRRFNDINIKIIDNLLIINDDTSYNQWFEIIINDPDSSVECMEYHTVYYGDEFEGSTGFVGHHVAGEIHTYNTVNHMATYEQFIEDNELDNIVKGFLKELEIRTKIIKDPIKREKIKQLMVEKIIESNGFGN